MFKLFCNTKDLLRRTGKFSQRRTANFEPLENRNLLATITEYAGENGLFEVVKFDETPGRPLAEKGRIDINFDKSLDGQLGFVVVDFVQDGFNRRDDVMIAGPDKLFSGTSFDRLSGFSNIEEEAHAFAFDSTSTFVANGILGATNLRESDSVADFIDPIRKVDVRLFRILDQQERTSIKSFDEIDSVVLPGVDIVGNAEGRIVYEPLFESNGKLTIDPFDISTTIDDVHQTAQAMPLANPSFDLLNFDFPPERLQFEPTVLGRVGLVEGAVPADVATSGFSIKVSAPIIQQSKSLLDTSTGRELPTALLDRAEAMTRFPPGTEKFVLNLEQMLRAPDVIGIGGPLARNPTNPSSKGTPDSENTSSTIDDRFEFTLFDPTGEKIDELEAFPSIRNVDLDVAIVTPVVQELSRVDFRVIANNILARGTKDAVNVSAKALASHSIEFDFGDGNVDSVSIPAQPVTQNFEHDFDGTISHFFVERGTYDVTVRLMRNNEPLAVEQVQVEVAPRGPFIPDVDTEFKVIDRQTGVLEFHTKRNSFEFDADYHVVIGGTQHPLTMVQGEANRVARIEFDYPDVIEKFANGRVPFTLEGTNEANATSKRTDFAYVQPPFEETAFSGPLLQYLGGTLLRDSFDFRFRPRVRTNAQIEGDLEIHVTTLFKEKEAFSEDDPKIRQMTLTFDMENGRKSMSLPDLSIAAREQHPNFLPQFGHQLDFASIVDLEAAGRAPLLRLQLFRKGDTQPLETLTIALTGQQSASNPFAALTTKTSLFGEEGGELQFIESISGINEAFDDNLSRTLAFLVSAFNAPEGFTHIESTFSVDGKPIQTIDGSNEIFLANIALHPRDEGEKLQVNVRYMKDEEVLTELTLEEDIVILNAPPEIHAQTLKEVSSLGGKTNTVNIGLVHFDPHSPQFPDIDGTIHDYIAIGDPSRDNLSVTIDWGDGTIETFTPFGDATQVEGWGGNDQISVPVVVSHTYSDDFLDNSGLNAPVRTFIKTNITVEDGDGGIDTAARGIAVEREQILFMLDNKTIRGTIETFEINTEPDFRLKLPKALMLDAVDPARADGIQLKIEQVGGGIDQRLFLMIDPIDTRGNFLVPFVNVVDESGIPLIRNIPFNILTEQIRLTDPISGRTLFKPNAGSATVDFRVTSENAMGRASFRLTSAVLNAEGTRIVTDGENLSIRLKFNALPPADFDVELIGATQVVKLPSELIRSNLDRQQFVAEIPLNGLVEEEREEFGQFSSFSVGAEVDLVSNLENLLLSVERGIDVPTDFKQDDAGGTQLQLDIEQVIRNFDLDNVVNTSTFEVDKGDGSAPIEVTFEVTTTTDPQTNRQRTTTTTTVDDRVISTTQELPDVVQFPVAFEDTGEFTIRINGIDSPLVGQKTVNVVDIGVVPVAITATQDPTSIDVEVKVDLPFGTPESNITVTDAAGNEFTQRVPAGQSSASFTFLGSLGDQISVQIEDGLETFVTVEEKQQFNVPINLVDLDEFNIADLELDLNELIDGTVNRFANATGQQTANFPLILRPGNGQEIIVLVTIVTKGGELDFVVVDSSQDGEVSSDILFDKELEVDTLGRFSLNVFYPMEGTAEVEIVDLSGCVNGKRELEIGRDFAFNETSVLNAREDEIQRLGLFVQVDVVDDEIAKVEVNASSPDGIVTGRVDGTRIGGEEGVDFVGSVVDVNDFLSSLEFQGNPDFAGSTRIDIDIHDIDNPASARRLVQPVEVSDQPEPPVISNAVTQITSNDKVLVAGNVTDTDDEKVTVSIINRRDNSVLVEEIVSTANGGGFEFIVDPPEGTDANRLRVGIRVIDSKTQFDFELPRFDRSLASACSDHAQNRVANPAGNIDITVDGSDVTIVGDALGNAVEIVVGTSIVAHRIGNTTINGLRNAVTIAPDSSRIEGDLRINTGAGNDSVCVTGFSVRGDVQIQTEDGNDVIVVKGLNIESGLSIDSGTGDDFISAPVVAVEGLSEFQGGDGNDDITATDGDDVISAGAGNDTIRDGHGDDQIDGGSGDDIFKVTPGSTDTIVDNSGLDRIDFSEAERGILIDMDELDSEQTVDANGNGLILIGGPFENITGSSFKDSITVRPLNVARHVAGGGAENGDDDILVVLPGNDFAQEGNRFDVPGFQPITVDISDQVVVENESPNVVGDFDGDGIHTANDIDLTCAAIGRADLQFDLNGDLIVDQRDMLTLVNDVMGTVIGDSNLDGVFDSRDLIQVFSRGEYEDEIPNNSGWANGDWNCDGEFSSNDLIAALQAGTFVSTAVAAPLDSAAVNHIFDELWKIRSHGENMTKHENKGS